MNLSNEGLDEIEQLADQHQNVNLSFQIQILREIRGLKELLKQQEKQLKKIKKLLCIIASNTEQKIDPHKMVDYIAKKLEAAIEKVTE